MILNAKPSICFVAVGAAFLAACGRPASPSNAASDGTAVPTTAAAVANDQFEQFVSIEIKSDDIDQFRSALTGYAAFSRTEAGNVRYDIYQSCDKPALFEVHETWQSDSAHTAHLNSAEYQSYSTEVGGYFAAPVVRQRVN